MSNDKVTISSRRWVKLADVSEFEEGKGKMFKIKKTRIAVFKHKSNFYAMDDHCPHQGGILKVVLITSGPLSMGDIEESPKTCKPFVSCPWHGWAYYLDSGVSQNIDDEATIVFPTKIDSNQLYVEISETEEVDF